MLSEELERALLAAMRLSANSELSVRRAALARQQARSRRGIVERQAAAGSDETGLRRRAPVLEHEGVVGAQTVRRIQWGPTVGAGGDRWS